MAIWCRRAPAHKRQGWVWLVGGLVQITDDFFDHVRVGAEHLEFPYLSFENLL